MDGNFVPYKVFKRKHHIDKIINFDENEMDIANDSKIKGGFMNALGEVFHTGDVILVDSVRVKIIGFAAYDYDWFGAICVGRNKNIAKWFRLDSVVNLTEQKKNKGTVYEVLTKNGFRKIDAITFVRNKMVIEVYDKSETFDAYCDYKGSEEMGSLVSGVSLEYLASFIDKMDTLRVPSMYFENIPAEYFERNIFGSLE